MKKIMFMVLALVLLFGVSAFASTGRYGTRTSQPLETTGIFNDQGGIAMDYSVWVYGVTIYADAANSYVGLYDCDTTVELNATTIYPRYEIGEPTQYETTTEMFTKPKYFDDGVGAIIFTGVAFIEYGPEPTD